MGGRHDEPSPRAATSQWLRHPTPPYARGRACPRASRPYRTARNTPHRWITPCWSAATTWGVATTNHHPVPLPRSGCGIPHHHTPAVGPAHGLAASAAPHATHHTARRFPTGNHSCLAEYCPQTMPGTCHPGFHQSERLILMKELITIRTRYGQPTSWPPQKKDSRQGILFSNEGVAELPSECKYNSFFLNYTFIAVFCSLSDTTHYD